jgi:SAM-dependent methyltransferase
MAERIRVSPAYDRIADWYAGYVEADTGGFTTRADSALRRVLGRGRGVCWDLACGTGVHARTIRELGWTPVGTDISAGQLRHAVHRLPVALGDATRPAVRPASVAAFAALLCHTDIDDYPAACRAAALALRPGGRFAHVGVHPCFIGAFADRSDPRRILIGPGYWRRERRFDAWCPHGVRARVGAVHLPLSDLVAAVTGAGLILDEVVEVGEPTPDVLAVRAHRPAAAQAADAEAAGSEAA